MNVVDYTGVKDMTFSLLEQKEIERQGSKDGLLQTCRVRLLCDCCGKPFTRWLHDIGLALSFCCSEKCLKILEKKARKEIENI